MLCESQSLETHDIVLDALIGCRQVYNHVIVGAGAHACPWLTVQPLVGGVSDADELK